MAQTPDATTDNGDAARTNFDHWLAKQPGVQSTETSGKVQFTNLGRRPDVMFNNLDTTMGDDPAKFLNDPKNKGYKDAITDYIKAPADDKTASPTFLKRVDDLMNGAPALTEITPSRVSYSRSGIKTDLSSATAFNKAAPDGPASFVPPVINPAPARPLAPSKLNL